MSQHDHASNPRGRRKARDGERIMEGEMARRMATGYALSEAINDLAALFELDALTGVAEIVRERRRQIEQKSYTLDHDRQVPADGALAAMVMAAAGALAERRLGGLADPSTDQSAMAEAGAMAAAEIDRLSAEFGPEPATYRCWRTEGGPGENGVTHHVHGPGQPCPLGLS